MKRMILAPHADDEVLGCGGLLAKYPQDCHVVVMCRASPVRFEEHRNAQDILQYKKSTNLGFADGLLSDFARQVVGRLDEEIRRYQPDELYLPYPDLHQDHIATYEAGMRAARASMKKDHWYVPSVYVYDVAAYTLELRPTGLKFDTFEDISGDPVLAKGKAMDAYVSETAPPPSPANGAALIKQAEALGAMHHLGAAEQFATVRRVR
ncbi:hydrolase [Arthrobacter phage DanielleIgnace]|nr:hydrolase [Arthrobacter phage DanielleIgnace]